MDTIPATVNNNEAHNQNAIDCARKEVRQLFRSKRNSLTLSAQQNAATHIVTQAIAADLFSQSEKVALYLSHDGELDTKPLIDYLWSQNKEVYLPVLHPFCKAYLIFLRYRPTTLMTANKFGIAEPALDVSSVCPVQNLDIIFTPLVAFDEQGNRMGMGGGFYDRTLQSLNNKNKCLGLGEQGKSTKLIGLAHDVQKTLSLPTQVWDIPLPAILTPTKLYSF
jgi:5-formyltetrahydrofolate cyclo-ligase